jgi:peptidoglycan/xylan/chitin deacetylase (PgdA/CDA1 family)
VTVRGFWLRRWAGPLRAVAAVALMWCLRWTRMRSGVVLMYHRVEPRQGDPRTEFTPPLHCDLFAWQLRHLTRHYSVVAADAIQEAVRGRRRGGRFPVALTFDDDTVSHAEHAAPLLRERGLPATFFLNGLALERARSYWWERLQTGYAKSGSWSRLIRPDVLAAAVEAAGHRQPEAYEITIAVQHMTIRDRRAWAEGLLERVGEDPPDAGLRAAQVQELHHSGFTIGFHGANHEPLSLLAPDELETELCDGRGRLEEVTGESLRLISYPHGQVDQRVAEAAHAHGFDQGFTVQEIAVTPGSNSMLLGRLDAQIDSRARFARQLAQVLRRANEAQ